MNSPFLSIITPVYNRDKLIKKAIESVNNQNFVDYEHIIVSKNSSENLKHYVKKFSKIKLYSSNDKSSHHAMVEGVKKSSGEIICFLNSDDWFEKDIFKEVFSRFQKKEINIMKFNYNLFKLVSNFELFQKEIKFTGRIEEILFGAPGFNSFFFRKCVFNKIGNFNTNYNFSADREFLIRLCSKYKLFVSKKTSYNYLIHNDSRTMGNFSEKKKIYIEHINICRSIIEKDSFNKIWKDLIFCWKAYETFQLLKFCFKNGEWDFLKNNYDLIRLNLFHFLKAIIIKVSLFCSFFFLKKN